MSNPVPNFAGADPGFAAGARTMESAWTMEREPVTGVWGQSPQQGPETDPLVGGQGQSPPEAESFWSIFIQKGQKLSF